MNDTVHDPPRQRVRLTYEKGEAIKFISHLDEFRMWERVLRRADLPLLYKQGYNPQPHIQFASPLGVGFTGRREPVDITFCPPLPLAELLERIRAKLPPGAAIHDIEEVPLKTESLQSLLIGADYTIIVYAQAEELDADELGQRIAAFLASSTIPRERQRKGSKYVYNLRPLIFELAYDGYDGECEEHRIFLRVQQRDGATGRPDEVVAALGLEDFARTLRRDRLYFSGRPADVALFAAYRVVDKDEVLISAEPRRRKRRRPAARSAAPRDEGRTISERAADEFG